MTLVSGKNIALFLDGTWNEPTDNTNVWRAKLMLAAEHNNKAQLAYYDTGVGTAWFERVRGGAFAKGLSANVSQAYQWLMENYEDGDDVFIFGFSRGAFTARSLAGMIARCGLLQPGAPLTIAKIFERYKSGKEVTPLHSLEHCQRKGKADFSRLERLLLTHSTRIPIKFIGVWDTVGTLGLPLGNIPGISSGTLKFHHTRPSIIYENFAQALAIDEHRKPYMPVMLFDYIPSHEDPAETIANEAELNARVEQRWFSGAHSNIGGGYEDDLSAQLPLAWMMTKASEAGLSFRRSVDLSGDEHKEPVVDSYAQFMKGAWKFLTLGQRYHREIGRSPANKTGGKIATINEVIDKSVFDRWRANPQYRPKNLVDWAERTGKVIDDLTDDVAADYRSEKLAN